MFFPLISLPLGDMATILMSPVHRSSSNIDTTALALFTEEGGEKAGSSTHIQDLEHDNDEAIPRSTSMPPSMFNEEELPHRDRTRSGICIQRNQGARVVLRQQSDLSQNTYAHARRNAFRATRGGRMLQSSTVEEHRRHSSPATAFMMSLSSGGGASPPLASPINEEDPIFDRVKLKLYEEEYFSLADVVERMPPALHDAILNDDLPLSCYGNLCSRVDELKHGHLASGDADSTPGSVHWFEGRSVHRYLGLLCSFQYLWSVFTNMFIHILKSSYF